MTVMNDDVDKEEDNDENYEDVIGERVSVGENKYKYKNNGEPVSVGENKYKYKYNDEPVTMGENKYKYKYNGEPVSVGETRGNLPLLASRSAALKNKHNLDDRGDDGNDDVLANHGDDDLYD